MLKENRAAIDSFLNAFSVSSVSEKSAEQYKSILLRFFENNKKVFSAISNEDLTKFLHDREEQLKSKSKDWEVKRPAFSIFYRVFILRVLIRFYKHHELEKIYNALKRLTPKLRERGQKIPLAIDFDQKNAITLAQISKDDFINARNALIACTLFSTGLRISELVSLNTADFEFEKPLKETAKVITITGKGQKERGIVFPKWLWQQLKEFKAKYPQFMVESLFCSATTRKRLSTKMGWYVIKQKAIVANVILQKRAIFPHALRSTYATDRKNEGADLLTLQAALGHASPATTARYTRIGKEDLLKMPLPKKVDVK